ncbi:hypothetical protein Scep_025196 [Stephania cephalantha]|uniref:O-methyltransferase n=1 Tax=Stephania cephalantha TaxID=152367 RepID=A0AAP0EL61_9MAGN
MATKNHNHNIKLSEEEEDFFYAMTMATSITIPWTIKAAVDLEVFDIISKAGPDAYLSASEILSHHKTENPNAAHMLERILCFLVSHSLLTCKAVTLESGHVQRRYGLTRASKHFPIREDGVSLSWFPMLAAIKEYLAPWPYLKDAVLDSGDAPIFDKVNGFSMFEYLTKNPDDGKIFNSANFSMTTVIMEKMVEVYKGFDGLKTLVDVGGGVGTCVSFISKKHPSMKIINFDLPSVVEHAAPIPGVEHVGGDMFESVPKAEAIFIKSVLHDWSDEHCLKVLKNCYEAIPDDGKVIIMELVFPEVPQPSSAMKWFYASDIVMMALLPGGKERSEDDLEVLARKAGFVSVKTACQAFGFWMIELRKCE